MYVIVNLAHPMGPTVLTGNDTGTYRNLHEAVVDVLAAIAEFKNMQLRVYQLVSVEGLDISELLSNYWFCGDCWDIHSIGKPCPEAEIE